METESEDSTFDKEILITKENKFELGYFDQNMEYLPQIVNSIVKKYNNCCMFVAPNDGPNGLQSKALINQLLE